MHPAARPLNSGVRPMSSYTFEIDHYLSEDEIVELADRCYPYLEAISARYAPEIDIEDGFPEKPEYFDVLRTSWLLDKSNDRPPHEDLVAGLGFGFGLLLGARTPLRWCAATDAYGDFVTMARDPEGGPKASVPVFGYVEKRETLQNAEVFVDFFKQVSSDIVGT